jgi:predicted O-methyltransferase YrrM
MSLRRIAVFVVLFGGLSALGFLLLLDRYLVTQGFSILFRTAVFVVTASSFGLLAGTAAVVVRTLLVRLERGFTKIKREAEQRSHELREEIREEIKETCDLIREEANESRRQVEGAVSLYCTLRPSSPFDPLQGWAISGDSGAHLVRLIATRRPLHIVELGSGVSTLLIGLAIRRFNLSTLVHSIEHDDVFAELTLKALHREDLLDIVNVVHAPLSDVRVGSKVYLWYDPSFLADLRPIDLLFIDGPPGHIGPAARYPALPLLLPKLLQSAIILLDDVNRPDEKDIIRKWREEAPGLKWRTWRAGGKGLAIGERVDDPSHAAGDLGTHGVSRNAALPKSKTLRSKKQHPQTQE